MTSNDNSIIKKCAICEHAMSELYHSSSETSITSLAVLIPGKTVAYVCSHCGHIETSSLLDLQKYYDSHYKIGASNLEEDDLYSMNGDQVLFRSEHMSVIFLEKISKYNIQKVLDYGCGKSLASKKAMVANPELDFFLFDVSQDYIEFWDTFRPKEKIACFETPRSWQSSFDCITSFFSLEHVPSPKACLTHIHNLLKKDGFLYVIVPNMYSVNRADLLVVDHLQHYSHSSMRYSLSSCGFELLDVDDTSHQQASIYIAKAIPDISPEIMTNSGEVAASVRQAQDIAHYWEKLAYRLNEFEHDMIASGSHKIYIYGAGIVGTYLYSMLAEKDTVAGFIDSNTHKQRKTFCGLPVFSPQAINVCQSDILLVGLNPGIGENIIHSYRQFDCLANNTFYC